MEQPGDTQTLSELHRWRAALDRAIVRGDDPSLTPHERRAVRRQIREATQEVTTLEAQAAPNAPVAVATYRARLAILQARLEAARHQATARALAAPEWGRRWRGQGQHTEATTPTNTKTNQEE